MGGRPVRQAQRCRWALLFQFFDFDLFGVKKRRSADIAGGRHLGFIVADIVRAAEFLHYPGAVALLSHADDFAIRMFSAVRFAPDDEVLVPLLAGCKARGGWPSAQSIEVLEEYRGSQDTSCL